MTIKMKATEQYFPSHGAVCMLHMYKVVINFMSDG